MEWILFILGFVSNFLGGIILAPIVRKDTFFRLLFAMFLLIASGMFIGGFILLG